MVDKHEYKNVIFKRYVLKIKELNIFVLKETKENLERTESKPGMLKNDLNRRLDFSLLKLLIESFYAIFEEKTKNKKNWKILSLKSKSQN